MQHDCEIVHTQTSDIDVTTAHEHEPSNAIDTEMVVKCVFERVSQMSHRSLIVINIRTHTHTYELREREREREKNNDEMYKTARSIKTC